MAESPHVTAEEMTAIAIAAATAAAVTTAAATERTASAAATAAAAAAGAAAAGASAAATAAEPGMYIDDTLMSHARAWKRTSGGQAGTEAGNVCVSDLDELASRARAFRLRAERLAPRSSSRGGGTGNV